MNSVYIDSAVANSPIYLGPTNANTINIGKEGASTNLFGYTNLGIVTSGTKKSFIEVGTGDGNAVIDFHSSGLFDTDYDSRIMSSGGTSAGGQGSLQLFAKTISITSPLTLGSIPDTNTQLGYRITLVNNTGYTTSATPGTITSPVNFTLPVGVWLVTASCQIISTVTWFTTSISSTSTSVLDFTRWCVVSNSAGGNVTNSIITTINNTSASTVYNYLIQSSGASATTTATYIYATRIG